VAIEVLLQEGKQGFGQWGREGADPDGGSGRGGGDVVESEFGDPADGMP
jgi:hypothetical protein